MADRKKKPRGNAPLISDPRFAKLHTDPRFQRIPKNKTKVTIDPRFEAMFKDPAFQSKFVVDKRGKKKGTKQGENLQKYYRLEGDENLEENADKEGEEILEVSPTRSKRELKTELKSEMRAKEGIEAGEKGVGGILEKKNGDKSQKGKKDRVKLEKKSVREEESLVDNGLESEADSESDPEAAGRDVLREGFGSEESSSSSDEEESEIEDEAEDKWEEPEKVPTSNEETRRLAIVNLDWEYIRAVDILVMLKSFLPEQGSIESVVVYPSDFGLERMKEEEVKGPQPLWGELGASEDEEESDGEGAGLNMEKLREYEKSKLRYYYAVVSCDSPATANVLYSSCDGLEFEKSSNKLDLRFIPDEMSFEGRPIRDESTAVPADYVAPDFETRALQHSNVKLTWDEDEPARQKSLRRKFGKEEIDNLDLNAYFADTDTDEEGSESDPEISKKGVENGSEETPLGDRNMKKKEKREKERERLRKLLLGGDDNQGKEGGGSEDEEDQEMEITFNTGLNDLGDKLEQKKREKELQANETTWEAYLRKKRERKKGRKKGTQTDGADESDGSMDDGDAFFQHDENPFNDPFFADGAKQTNEKLPRGKKNEQDLERGANENLPREKSNKKTARELEREKKREETEAAKREEARQKADLELLMMDDDLVMAGRLENGSEKLAGFNLKAERRKEKDKLKKKKGQRVDEDAIEDEQAASNAKVDFEDPRFGALFTSHHFAIDPTDPRFSKTSGQLEVLAEKQRRRAQKGRQNGQSAGVSQAAREPALPLKQPRAELNSLVKSLKRKVEAKSSKESRNKEAKRGKPSF